MQYIIFLAIVNAFSFGATLILARCISVSDFGKLMGEISIISLIAVISSLGKNEFDVREVLTNGKKVSIKNLVFSILLGGLIYSVYVIYYRAQWFLLPFLVLLILGNYVTVLLKVEGRNNLLAVFQKPANLVKIFMALLILLLDTNISFAMLISATAIFVAIFFIALQILRVNPKLIHVGKSFLPEKESLGFLVNEVAMYFIIQSPILIMTLLKLYDLNASFSLALLVYNAISLLVNAYFISYITPKFYKAENDCLRKAVLNSTRSRSKIMLILLIPPYLLSTNFVMPTLINSSGFDSLKLISSLLLIPLLMKVMYLPYYGFMCLEENIKYKNSSLLVASLASLVASILLIPAYGTLGAVASYTLAEFYICVRYITRYKCGTTPNVRFHA